MCLKGDALGDIWILADRLGGALDRLWEILHDKLHPPPPPAQVDAHEAVAAPDVDQRAPAGVHVGQVVVVDEVGDLVALAAGQAGHGLAHAPGAHGVPAKGGEHGLPVDGAKGDVEAGARERGGLGVVPERLQGVGGRGEDVLRVEPDPGPQVRVPHQHPGRGRVGDVPRGRLPEDGVRHGMAQVAGQVDGIKRGFGFQLGQRDGPIQRDKAGYRYI